MNRLHHLQQTLQRNMLDNSDYVNSTYLILDYSSNDGLENYIKENYSIEISQEKLSYVRLEGAKRFNPSHAKNIAMCSAQGEIICNVNADHYLGKNFLARIAKLFVDSEFPVVITPITVERNGKIASDLYGLVCLRKQDFMRVNGYDERIYCFEDYDLINRLEMVGVKRANVNVFDNSSFISHSDFERFPMDKIITTIKALLINYITPFKSIILLLKRDGTFEKRLVVDNFGLFGDFPENAYSPKSFKYQYSQDPSSYMTGYWTLKTIKSFELYDGNHTFHEEIANDEESLGNVYSTRNGQQVYYKINDQSVFEQYITFVHFIEGRTVMENNLSTLTAIVNLTGFGKGDIRK